MDNNNYFFAAFGTFGNPNGFKQSFWFTKDKSKAIGIKTFDLNTNAIKLFPNSRLYAIRKENINSSKVLSYSLYTYAREKNSDRSGTFIGSSILFTGQIADEQLTINKLNEFHKNLIRNNVQNDVISVNHSDKLFVTKPLDYNKIEFHLKPLEDLDFIQYSNTYLVVFCEVDPLRLSLTFQKSLDLLNKYDAIYFTDSREVATFVNQKGIFKLIQHVGSKEDLDEEIQGLQEEKTRRVAHLISQFSKEFSSLEEERIKSLNRLRDQICRNEEIHQENERIINDTKSDVEQLNKTYAAFSLKLRDHINDLKSGKKLDEIKHLYSENRKIFIEALSHFKKPASLSTILMERVKSDIKLRGQADLIGKENSTHNNEEYWRIRNRASFFKATSFTLLFFFIATWVYFLLPAKAEVQNLGDDLSEGLNVQPQIVSSKEESTLISNLTPAPNSELSENDYRLVASAIKYNTKVEDVVQVIFAKNPTDIKSSYERQATIYSKMVIDLNRNCFVEKEGAFYFTKDTLRHIPSYKNLK